jgi:hypothetical protein
MNPDTRLILDEMNKRFDDLQSTTDRKFAKLDDKWVTTFGDFEETWSSRFVEHATSGSAASHI